MDHVYHIRSLNTPATFFGPPPTPPPAPPAESDPFPFKLYRGGVQIAERSGLYLLTNAVYAMAQSGDTIKVAGGTYSPGSMAWYGAEENPNLPDRANPPAGTGKADVNQATLTIEALDPNNKPIIEHTLASISTGPSYFIQMGQTCTNLTVRNLRVRSTWTGDNQHCFIRGISGDYIVPQPSPTSTYDAVPYVLTVEGCEMLGFKFNVETSENWNGVTHFNYNDVGQGRTGGNDLSHGVYFGTVAAVYCRGNRFRRYATPSEYYAGHLLKSRSRVLVCEANFFDGSKSSGARAVDYAHGGELTFVGNVIIHGEDNTGTANQQIGFAPEQRRAVFIYDGRNQSIVFAQNTVRDSQLGIQTGNPEMITIWPPVEATVQTTGTARGGTQNTIQLATDAPTVALGSLIFITAGTAANLKEGAYRKYVSAWDEATKTATISRVDDFDQYQPVVWWDDGTIPDATSVYKVYLPPTEKSVTKTVRNNVVASVVNDVFGGAQAFVARYPDNSRVEVSDIDSNNGELQVGDIPGSPLVNDAPYEWVDVFTTPIARTDTNRGAHHGLPAYAQGQAVYEWREIPNSKLSDFVTAHAAIWAHSSLLASNGPNAIITAWNGAIWDDAREEVGSVGAGGHADYAGNGVPALNLRNPAGWFSVRDPSLGANVAPEVRRYPDGTPVSAHTYFWQQCIRTASVDRWMRFASAGVYGSGGANFQDLVGFNRASGLYDQNNTWADIPFCASNSDTNACSAPLADLTVFKDPATQCVYAGRSQWWVKWNPATNAWTTVTLAGPFVTGHAAAVDTRRNRVLCIGGSGIVDVNTPNAMFDLPNITNAAAVTFSGPNSDFLDMSALGSSAYAASIGYGITFYQHPTDGSQDCYHVRNLILGGTSTDHSGGTIYRIRAVAEGDGSFYVDSPTTTGGSTIPAIGRWSPMYNRMHIMMGRLFMIPRYDSNVVCMRLPGSAG